MRCPNDHEERPVFDVAQLRADLARGQVQYFCFRCRKTCQLSLAEHARLTAWLDGRI